MSQNLKPEPPVKAVGPLGLGAIGWIVIGALIGVALLLAIPHQAPFFALGGIGVGIGVIVGTGAGRLSQNASRKK